MVLFFVLVTSVSATWCDADYAKRVNVNVNNTAGGAVTDYQVYVDLSANPINEASLRVYNSSDCTLRPHWTENETGGNSYGVWINYSTIAASAWTNNTAIYYEYTAASSTSDGNNTFEFFDDFSGGTTINETYLTGWTKSGSNPLQSKTCQNWFITVYSNYSGEDKIYIFENRDDFMNNTIEALSFTRANASTPTNWTDHGIIYTSTEAWGGTQPHHIEPHGIFFETQSMADAREGVGAGLGTPKWRMYYNLHVAPSSNAQIGFMVASEDNLLNWTPYSNNPVYPKTGSEGYADCKVCIYNNEVWMHLCIYTAGGGCLSPFFTVSNNGIDNWTDKTSVFTQNERTVLGTIVPFDTGILLTGNPKPDMNTYEGRFTTHGEDKAAYSGNPILSGGGTGVWDEKLGWCSIVVDKEGSANLSDAGTFYMYYTGYTGGVTKLGLTTSTTLTEESETTSTLDTNKWNSSGTPTVSDGKLTLTNEQYITSKTTYTGGHALKVRAKAGTDSTGIFWTTFTLTQGSLMSVDGTNIFRYRDTDTYFTAVSADGINLQLFDYATTIDTLWHVAEGRRTGTTDEFQFDAESPISGNYPTNVARYVELYAYTADIVADWVFVRKYASPEPSSVLGDEEQQSATTPVISNVQNGSINTTAQWVSWDVNQSAHNRVKYSNESDLTPTYWSSWQNTTNAPNITLNGLEASTQYWYQVWSHNTSNTSLYDNSSTMSFTTASVGEYIPPDPTNLQNSTSNFWINHTWNVGSGNITNSYNVSIGVVWHNTTTTTCYNDSGLSAHDWSNVTVWAYNNSGDGTLSSGSVSQNTQIPNNVPALVGLPDNTTDEDVNQTDIFDLDAYFCDVDGDTPTYLVESNNQSANVNVTINASNNVSYTLASGWNGTASVVINVTDGWSGEDNDTFLIIVNAAPLPGHYTPGNPINLQNTTGNYWVNYTWSVGGGNVTDFYNVSWNSTWYNSTTNTFMKKEVGASNWVNITVYAYNTSGNGSLSTGNLTDNVQAPAYAPGDYPPATPTSLANTTGNGWVNYTWASGGGANVTDSYNVSWNLTWYNNTLVSYMNDSVGEFGWANISVWAFNSSGNGSLSTGSISDETQAEGSTFTTSMTTTAYNLITYYGSSTSTAEQFGLDIGSVDYIALYNGSFYTHTMGFSANNFTTYHGIGYYVYLNASGSSTYQRTNISDVPYNTQLFNRWNTIGWTNATDTNAEGIATSIGSACKYTSSLNIDGITYTTHTVGFTSNNHAVEKGKGYWVWVNTGVNWGRNS